MTEIDENKTSTLNITSLVENADDPSGINSIPITIINAEGEIINLEDATLSEILKHINKKPYSEEVRREMFKEFVNLRKKSKGLPLGEEEERSGI